MKAKANMKTEEVYLEYEITEHDAFLAQRAKYEGAGLKIESYNGQDKFPSWIKANKWL